MITDQPLTNQGDTNLAMAIDLAEMETPQAVVPSKELKWKIPNNMESGRDLVDESSAPNA